MKIVIVLCILSALLLQIDATPVKFAERDARSVAGRQQSTSVNEVAPPIAASDDDDDDDEDDDDDDGDIGDIGDLVDDDEDDDDEEEDDDDDEEDDTPQGQAAPAAGSTSSNDDEEDDDDDDYLDRLFDDILGDDDEEDDDDEEVSPAASVQNPVAAVAPSVEDIAPAGQAAANAGSGISDGVDLPLESGQAADVSVAGIGEDAGATNIKNEGALAAAAAAEESDDNEDDDDDDDDDIIGDDVIEARREARALKNNIIDMSQDAFQERHNHFIDSIFERINRIVTDNYDPFVVRLNARPELKDASAEAAGGKTKSTKSTAGKKKQNNKPEARAMGDMDGQQERKSADSDSSQQKAQSKLQQQMEQLQQEQPSLKATEPKEQEGVDKSSAAVADTKETHEEQSAATGAAAAATATVTAQTPEVRTVFANNVVKAGSTASKKSPTKSHKHHSTKKGGSGHNSNSAGTSSATSSKQKLKQTNGAAAAAQHSGKGVEKLQNAEGSLSGLASLKRVGNVKMTSDPEGRNSTIKAKFTLGPLILRVEKSFKRGGVQNVKSATARTNEMFGRIKFSVVNDRATLMSIKVQQPKQVEVESKDNHDRTREFIWRRTPKIAKLVNEKLKLAAESIFTPQGVEVVRL